MPTLGEQLKADGMEAVLENQEGWVDSVEAYVRKHLRGRKVTGEEIRLLARSEVGNPRHPNAWGAAISALVQKGLLVDTGYVRNMGDPRSHARRTPIWEVTDEA